MEKEDKELGSAHAMYRRILQPAYERMILQHVTRNNINLKTGATGQLLHKRPKTTGYLTKKGDGTNYTTSSAYWNPGAYESWQWHHSVTPSVAQSMGYLQDAPRAVTDPQWTDVSNMKTSSRANTFSATTRVREVPVSGVYKKEIQQFRSRSPSARGVRASALTNRSLIATQPANTYSACATSVRGKSAKSEQNLRLQREHVQLELARERKRQTQVASHRIDRLYYMHGSSTKIHRKYNISEEDLQRLHAIAISKGIKVSSLSQVSHRRPSTTSGPNSSPREIEDTERLGSAKTIIPTGETMSVNEDVIFVDEKESTPVFKEDRYTSDNEDIDAIEERNASKVSEEQSTKTEEQEVHSVKSDSAVLQSNAVQRNVTFITEKVEE